MWVKICGITREEDAEKAIQLGAHAIGFIFAPSPRRVVADFVRSMAAKINILKVGVFVDASLQEVKRIRDECRLDIVQLHGNESPEFCKKLGGTIIKAFRARDANISEHFAAYTNVWKFLLDTYVPHQAGGTGKQIDRHILDQIGDFSKIILAGGLGPENVRGIIDKYKPFGIDINSGVETAPGIKNAMRMKELFEKL